MVPVVALAAAGVALLGADAGDVVRGGVAVGACDVVARTGTGSCIDYHVFRLQQLHVRGMFLYVLI